MLDLSVPRVVIVDNSFDAQVVLAVLTHADTEAGRLGLPLLLVGPERQHEFLAAQEYTGLAPAGADPCAFVRTHGTQAQPVLVLALASFVALGALTAAERALVRLVVLDRDTIDATVRTAPSTFNVVGALNDDFTDVLLGDVVATYANAVAGTIGTGFTDVLLRTPALANVCAAEGRALAVWHLRRLAAFAFTPDDADVEATALEALDAACVAVTDVEQEANALCSPIISAVARLRVLYAGDEDMQQAIEHHYTCARAYLLYPPPRRGALFVAALIEGARTTGPAMRLDRPPLHKGSRCVVAPRKKGDTRRRTVRFLATPRDPDTPLCKAFGAPAQ